MAAVTWLPEYISIVKYPLFFTINAVHIYSCHRQTHTTRIQVEGGGEKLTVPSHVRTPHLNEWVGHWP